VARSKDPVGVMAGLHIGENPFAAVKDFGLAACQLVNWDPRVWDKSDPAALRKEADTAGVEVVAVWAGYPGPAVWDLVQGPDTLGLVPPEWRAVRIAALKQGADFAKAFGAPAIITHCGFIPFECSSRRYRESVAAIAEVADYCDRLGIGFWFETGQEAPVTLLRVIQDLRYPGLGINLDPANLILYGMANPIDALDVFGQYVRCLHAKDGMYPTDGYHLGHEVKVGTGKVDFPRLVKRLDEIGFDGAYIIEREISGEQQKKDIAETVTYLKGLLK
jgi:L-ribulose-5-phosphate 3-epimerase